MTTRYRKHYEYRLPAPSIMFVEMFNGWMNCYEGIIRGEEIKLPVGPTQEDLKLLGYAGVWWDMEGA